MKHDPTITVYDDGPSRYRLGSEGVTIGTIWANQTGLFAVRTGFEWATLFAAAPKLLEACKAALHTCSGAPDPGSTLIMLRAAIAAAEGKQS
jgi:hypothetical protein